MASSEKPEKAAGTPGKDSLNGQASPAQPAMAPQPFGIPTAPIPVTQRIITNYYTAKRLLQVLQVTLQRHEGAFGVVETDVQRRVQPTITR